MVPNWEGLGYINCHFEAWIVRSTYIATELPIILVHQSRNAISIVGLGRATMPDLPYQGSCFLSLLLNLNP